MQALNLRRLQILAGTLALALTVASCTGLTSMSSSAGGAPTSAGGSTGEPGAGGTGSIGGMGSLSRGSCPGEEPIGDSGTFTCDGSIRHRRRAGSCKADVNLGALGMGGQAHPENTCRDNRDCPEGSVCKEFFSLTNNQSGTTCARGCLKDDDCAKGWVCDCLEEKCVEASCLSDADCDGGFCLASTAYLGFNFEISAYSCEQPEDACRGQNDCPELPYGDEVAICEVSLVSPRVCGTALRAWR